MAVAGTDENLAFGRLKIKFWSSDSTLTIKENSLIIIQSFLERNENIIKIISTEEGRATRHL